MPARVVRLPVSTGLGPLSHKRPGSPVSWRSGAGVASAPRSAPPWPSHAAGPAAPAIHAGPTPGLAS